jgi:hypothetical protein
VPPAHAREQVDDHGEAGQQRRSEDEDQRPAPDCARAEVDVAGRALSELDLLVEGAEERLRRASHRSELPPVEAIDAVSEGRRRPRPGRRQREGRHAVSDERGLLVEAEWEGEVDQLRGGGGMLGLGAGLLEDPERRRAHECRRG